MALLPENIQYSKIHAENTAAQTGRLWRPPRRFRVVQAAWLVLVVVFLAYYFHRNWGQFLAFSWDIRPSFILAALFFSALRRLLGSLRWVAISLYPSDPWSRRNVLRQMSVYFISGLAVYIPGNIWFVANRIYLGQNSGMSIVKSSLALTYETGITIWASIVVGSYVGLSLFVSSTVTLAFLAVFFLILSFVLFNPHTVHFSFRMLEKIVKRPVAQVNVSPVWVASLVGISFSILIFGGISLYCVFKALGVENPGSLIYVISALSLAWTLGFCTPWAPSGLGVQEGFIIYFFSYLAAPAPAVAAICMRLLYVFEDVFWGGLAVIVFSRQKISRSAIK